MTNQVRYILLSSVLLALAPGPVRAQGVYEYIDDFAGKKAQVDCWRSSIFWPGDINNPPARPYLSYRGAGKARGLVFMDYQGEPAQLEYRFLFGAMQTGTLVRGTVQVDVSFPCTAEIAQFPLGELFYSTSPDGQKWSPFLSVDAVHNEIAVQFTEGVCHVQFRGARAMIDNLRVSPSTPGITLRASQNSTAGLTSSGSAPSIFHVDWQFGWEGNDGKSRATAFAAVQKAIDTARNGDIVVIWPGLYQEEIAFKGKAITVQSAADAAIITAPNGYAFSFFRAEGARSILANLVITGCGTGGIFCNGASPTLRNLTVTGNQAGINAYGGAAPRIVNCILWQNSDGQLSAEKNFNWQISYSCIGPSKPGNPVPNKAAGNIDADPAFADASCHLKSQWGRYAPLTDTWVFDPETSPCIDAGDPADTPRTEGPLNGWLINMGAHGGTPFASHSSNGPVCQ